MPREKKHITRKNEGGWYKYTVVDSKGIVRLVTGSQKEAKKKLKELT